MALGLFRKFKLPANRNIYCSRLKQVSYYPVLVLHISLVLNGPG